LPKNIRTNPERGRRIDLVVAKLRHLVCFSTDRCGPNVLRGFGVHDPEIPVVLVERDAGQRLYDRDLRRYITVDDLYAWQLMSVPFIVRDAESGEDITATIMLEGASLH
jgi:hypothetical protein